MSALTTETRVRAKFQLLDTTLVPSDLIEAAIDDAHTELLRFLAPDVDLETPEEALAMGETLLAGAHLYRTLGSKDAFDQKRLAIGSNRVEGSGRFDSLLAIAMIVEKQAWYLLEPYLGECASRCPCSVTVTQPVLGEE